MGPKTIRETTFVSLVLVIIISRSAFYCFCCQGKQFAFGKQFSLRPKGEKKLKRINPVTITETEIRNVLTLLFRSASLVNILFKLQLRYHARVTWGLAAAHYWHPRVELKKAEKSGISLRVLVCSPAGETKQSSSSPKRRIVRDHRFFQRFFLK